MADSIENIQAAARSQADTARKQQEQAFVHQQKMLILQREHQQLLNEQIALQNNLIASQITHQDMSSSMMVQNMREAEAKAIGAEKDAGTYKEPGDETLSYLEDETD